MAKSENLTIMFTDIAGFSELVAKMSRKENEEMMKRHDAVLNKMLRVFKGRHVKSVGDSFLVVFRSPTDAALCAMAMHDALWEMSATLPKKKQITIRVAINLGEVRLTRNDVYGEAVNIAARLEHVTPPGEVYLTEAVYLSMNKAEVSAEYIDTQKFKGCPEPVRFYKVPRGVKRVTVPEAQSTAGSADEREVDFQYPFGGVHLDRLDPIQHVSSIIEKASGGITQVKYQLLGYCQKVLGSIRQSNIFQWLKRPRHAIIVASSFLVLLLAGFAVSHLSSNSIEPAVVENETSQGNVEEPVDLPETVALKLDQLVDTQDVEGLGNKVAEYSVKYPENAYLSLLSGHVNYEKKQYLEAIKAYQFAINADPELTNDDNFSENVVNMLDVQKDQIIEWLKAMTSISDSLIQALSKRTGLKGLQSRNAAIDILQHHQETSDIDYVGFHYWNFLEHQKCADKKVSLEKLVSYTSDWSKTIVARIADTIEKYETRNGESYPCYSKNMQVMIDTKLGEKKNEKNDGKTWIERFFTEGKVELDSEKDILGEE